MSKSTEDWGTPTKVGGSRIVKMGDGEGQVERFVGVLLGIDHNADFDKPEYRFITPDTEEQVIVASNTALDNRMKDTSIGKPIEIVFTGWGVGKKGNKFKTFEVTVFENPTEAAKKRFPKFYAAQASAAAAAAPLEQAPEALAESEDDGLPF